MRASKARTGHRTGRTVSQALERIRQVATATSPLHTQGGSRVREFRMHGSVRGAAGNSRPYRDHQTRLARVIRFMSTCPSNTATKAIEAARAFRPRILAER